MQCLRDIVARCTWARMGNRRSSSAACPLLRPVGRAARWLANGAIAAHVGPVLDMLAIILLTIPVFFPPSVALGYDPVEMAF